MYKRKIEEMLRLWKMKEGHKPLIIKGCRQCGKTSSVVSFAEQNYEHVVYMDFHEHKEYKAFFAGALDVDTLTLNMSVGIKGAQFVPRKTCIIFDEIQDCPNARSSLKFFKLDFLIRYKGECMPLECKAKTGNAKSLQTVLKHPEQSMIRMARG